MIIWLKGKHILYAFTICSAIQTMHLHAMQNTKIIALIPSDFSPERGDSIFLECLFKQDYSMLMRDHVQYPYYEGKGTEVFKNCVVSTQINGRKILTDNNRPIAFVIYFIAQDNENGHLQDGDGIMPLMGVHPDFRRLGYGKATMEYVIHWFKDQKCQQAWLSVNKKNTKAQDLYKLCGFENTGKTSWGESIWWVLPLSLSYKSFSMSKKSQLTDTRFAFQ